MDTPLYDGACIEDKWPYLDLVQVWLTEPLGSTGLGVIAQHCTSVHEHNRPMGFHRDWRQRLQLHQPSDDALLLLDRFSEGRHLVNAVEFSLDLILDDGVEAEKLRVFFDRHLIQRWHGKNRVSRSGSITYWGGRWSRNQPVIYHDRYSKVTGQVFCVHLEWRTKQASAVRALGIGRLHDLVGFNHREFWTKKLQLRAVDYGKLGRIYRKTRRRNPWIVEWLPGHPFDMDRKIGKMIVSASQRSPLGSVQEIKDYCPFNIDRALVKLPADEYWPL